MAKRNAVEFVLRPFEGLPGEPDWVAMREVVPAATATARTTAEYGSRDVVVSTVLPLAHPALHRADGTVMVALQTHTDSGDASRDVADALLRALDAAPGTPIVAEGLPEPGPRLQDVLDLSVPFEVTVHEGFEFWMAPDAESTPEVQASLEQASSTVVPTVRLGEVEGAYWCRYGSREYLRWAMPQDEEALLDALARLHARREATVGDGTKILGAFRACGIVVPVWDLVPGTGAQGVEAHVGELEEKLAHALAQTGPLTYDERRARAGLVSRQLTLR